MSAKGRTLVIRPPASTWMDVRAHLRELMSYGDLLRTLSRHRINVRYRQTLLGVAWAVLQPLLLMLIFAVVFSRLARIPSEGAPYPLFAYAALLPWTCFSTAVTNATGSLVSHTQLITKVYFPREILPITYIVAALFDFTLGLAALAGLITWYEVSITLAALWLIPLVALLAAWILAVSLALSAASGPLARCRGRSSDRRADPDVRVAGDLPARRRAGQLARRLPAESDGRHHPLVSRCAAAGADPRCGAVGVCGRRYRRRAAAGLRTFQAY